MTDHPAHHFVVKKLFAPCAGHPAGWGNLADCAVTFHDAVDAVIEAIKDSHIVLPYDVPSRKTVLVIEIDGRAAMDRTEDVIGECVQRYADSDNVPPAWQDLMGETA